jgi:cardiolipin synthase
MESQVAVPDDHGGSRLHRSVQAEQAASPTPPPGAPRAATDRIVTLPNLFSLGRLCCIPIFVYLLFGRDNRAAAAWLLGVLGMTDWVDGYMARRLGQVSELGKILDPVADRLLLLVGITSILVDGSAPLWFGVAVLAREAIVAGASLLLASLGARRIDVTWWGKAGTFAMMWAFPFWLGGKSTLSYAPVIDTAAWFFALPGLVASYYAAARYVPLARRALREGRAERARHTRSGPR